MYNRFLFLLLCIVIGFLTVWITPLFNPTVDRTDCFFNGFIISFVMFVPLKWLSLSFQQHTRIPNFLLANQANILHATPPALGVAVLCAVTLPVVAPTAWVVGCSILAFAAVIGLYLYLQGGKTTTSITRFGGDLDPNTGNVSALSAGDTYYQGNGTMFQATAPGTGNWVPLNFQDTDNHQKRDSVE